MGGYSDEDVDGKLGDLAKDRNIMTSEIVGTYDNDLVDNKASKLHKSASLHIPK